MELTTLKEFYQKKDNKNIKSYREYLANIKRQICEGMIEAKKIFDDQDSAITQISDKIAFIEKIEGIIANSIREIVNNSITNMSDAELKTIIDEYIDELSKEKNANNLSLDELNKKREEKLAEHIRKMQLLGYKDSYYKVADVDDFFKDVVSAEDYTFNLVQSNLDKTALIATFSWLYASDEVRNQLADMIISIRKIAKASDETVVRKAISKFLTPEKIGRIIGSKEKNECLRAFEILQKELKFRTEFFEVLPSTLQQDIRDKGLDKSEAYKRIYDIYEGYKANGHVTMLEIPEVQNIEDEIANVQSKINVLDMKIAGARSACEKRTTMMSLVESFINLDNDENNNTYSEISKETIDKRTKEQRLTEKREELSRRLEELEARESKLNLLISKGDFVEYFNILHAKRDLENRSPEEDVEDKKLEAIAKAERRRMLQFNILCGGILKLKELQDKIDAIDNSHNLFKNITGANKKLKEELLESYTLKVDEIYDELNEKGLAYIIVSSDDPYSLGDPRNQEAIQKPLSFESLMERFNVPKYQIDEKMLLEFKARRIVANYTPLEEVNKTYTRIYDLTQKLFGAEKQLDGTYNIAISYNEIDELLRLYEQLASAYEYIHLGRKLDLDNKKTLASKEFDSYFVELVNSLGLDLNNLTWEKANAKYEEVKKDILTVQKELNEINREMPTSDPLDLQYDVLEGFDETYLSPNGIRKIVQFH